MDEEEIDGEFIDPRASDAAQEAILKGRRLIYSPQFQPMVKQALTGAESLVQGVVPIIGQLIVGIEDKLGPLSDEDLEVVARHLAGTLVKAAAMLGDPDAEDIGAATMAIVQEIMVNMADDADGAAPPETPQQPMGQFA